MVSILDVKIGFFLARRQIMRASLWTTGLIVFVMVLTFLNLVVVSGILVGLIQGSVNQNQEQYTGDVIISSLTDKKYIENSPGVIGMIQGIPEVNMYSARYRSGGSLEANYKTRLETDEPNVSAGQIVGIDPGMEDRLTGLSAKVIEGEYLTSSDFDQVLIGSYLLKRFVPVDNPGFAALNDVYPGTKIRLSVNGIVREVTVKGVIKSKVGDVGQSVYMVDSQLRSMIGRNDGNVAEIALKVKPGVKPSDVRDALIRSGADHFAKVQTFEEAQPKFLKDMIKTFSTLGAMLGSIGLVVAAITIFIVIFINAVTRRKFIGILKGIGINGKVIEISYIFQSIFYAVCGSFFGLILVYTIMVPYFAMNPIDFPFSDGILVAPLGETFFRVGLLVVSTVIAGFIPARMIVRKNTLDSILGRN